MVEREIPPGFEDAHADREHEIEVRLVAECGGGYPDATIRGRSAAPDPAAAMQVDLVAARRLNAHRLITIRRKEEMAVIGSHDGLLDASRGELTDRPR